MFGRQRTGSVLCPSCGSLVGVNDEVCYTCGRRRPALFGFAQLLRTTGEDMGLLALVMGGCSLLFIATLVTGMDTTSGGGLLGLLAPNTPSVVRWGATGSLPVFRLGRWWTLLSAGWLHGGIIHIVFNMMAARDLIPAVAHLYGPGRTVILYTVSSVAGFALSSFTGWYLPGLPRMIGGAPLTLGASAAIFGLVGAIAWYGRRGGSHLLRDYAARWVVSGVVLAVMMPAVNNLAHLGGFVGGWALARWLDPLLPERGDHVVVAFVCLGATALSILASLAF